MNTVDSLITIINKNIQNIQSDLSLALVGKQFTENYETLWRAHEEAVIGIIPNTIIKYAGFLSDKDFGERKIDNSDADNQFQETGIEQDSAEFVEAIKTPKSKARPKKKKKNKENGKNRLADSEIRIAGKKVLLSIKSAKAGETPGNDLGTFNSYEKKKMTYAAAYEIWIFYSSEEKTKTITQVFFNRSFYFIGKHQAAGGVNYREKDGNMRPKNWRSFVENKNEWQSYEEFEIAFDVSQKYRANRVVLKQLPFMTDETRLHLLQRLIGEFMLPDELRLDFYEKLKNKYIFANDNADKIKIYEELLEEYKYLIEERININDLSKCQSLDYCFVHRMDQRNQK